MDKLECQKRRRVVMRASDGSTSEKQKCAHGAASCYGQEVDEDACYHCTLRQPLTRIGSSCREHPPSKAIWGEPTYYLGDHIIYPAPPDTDPPPVPEGYERRAEEGGAQWSFQSKWGQCPYRQMMNKLTPRGDLHIAPHCTAQKSKAVCFEECEACLIQLSDVGASLDKEQVKSNVPVPEEMLADGDEEGVPNFPHAAKLLENYWKAVSGWIAAGRPVRTGKEVKRVYNDFCASCDWYDPESQRCKGCGCSVKPKGIALLNKIKMATEHCPRKFW